MTQNRTFSIIMPPWQWSATTTSPSARQEKPAAEKIQKVSLFVRE